MDFVRCAQWLACPGASPKPGADPGAGQNCSLAPHVINHSWGGDLGSASVLDKAILYYHAAGIIPVFAQGNGGPRCDTQGYPGGFSYVLSIGSIGKDNTVWTKSSRGPPDHDMNLIKPDVVAPGHRVRIANISSDSSYLACGTSFAAPYVAGIVALMLQKNPHVNFKLVKEILLASTVPTVGKGESCGGKSDDEFPNFIAGYGRIDANKVIEYMDKMKE